MQNIKSNDSVRNFLCYYNSNQLIVKNIVYLRKNSINVTKSLGTIQNNNFCYSKYRTLSLTAEDELISYLHLQELIRLYWILIPRL